jgi:hypothetical protein
MTKREIGFLLIGLGSGLALTFVATIEILKSLRHLDLIDSYSWDRASIAIPVALIIVGFLLLIPFPKHK